MHYIFLFTQSVVVTQSLPSNSDHTDSFSTYLIAGHLCLLYALRNTRAVCDVVRTQKVLLRAQIKSEKMN